MDDEDHDHAMFGERDDIIDDEDDDFIEDDDADMAAADSSPSSSVTGKRKNDEISSPFGSKRARPPTEDELAEQERERRLAEGGKQSWYRPVMAPLDPSTEAVYVQHVDAEYTMEQPRAVRGQAQLSVSGQRVPVIRFFGTTAEGHSVMLHVHNYFPYFYVPCWDGFTQADVQAFGTALENKLSGDRRFQEFPRRVLAVTVEQKQSLWGFHFGERGNFMKVTMAHPQMVATCRRLLGPKSHSNHSGGGIVINGVTRTFPTYESNIAFVLRFMIDMDIQGCSWVEAPATKYSVRRENEKRSLCQLEIDILADSLIAHAPTQGRWMRNAPLRTLSFDIECAGRAGHFPEADQDPVIQIANYVIEQGRAEPVAKNVFTLNTCASIAGAQVLSFEREEDLLRAWKDFVQAVDPDILTGYNIINFDLPYLLDRAAALKVRDFPRLGRLRDRTTRVKKDKEFSSKAYGTSSSKDINIEGRVQFDVIKVIRREYKLRSYSLNAVSAHFLKQQKEDVHHSIITDLQNGNADTRRRLAVYCIKDAVLPVLLVQKLLLLINYIEMARVTGVPLSYLLTRGQQIKVVSQLCRKARSKGLLMPVRQRVAVDDKYEGATVLDPLCSFYNEPIATLDFASLYPSIMMAHNLCYTTIVHPSKVSELDSKGIAYEKTPIGAVFVTSDVQEGILPEILKELLAARKQAKKEMKAATDQFLKDVLNGRQLALKISANSVYGFTGAQVGQLPCLQISSSVTAYGRNMIDKTKKCVEEMYEGSVVVYGDTDSVMVKFHGAETVAEAMRLGEEAAQRVSQVFKAPIRLEFEKVYFPYLLMNKKRYAGLYWTRPDRWDKMDSKGIETVRRDNCRLVSNVVQEVLDQILIHRSQENALQYVRNTVSDLLNGRIDLSLLVMSKALGKESDYKNKNTTHLALARRMFARDPATAPKAGDRVAYVVIQGYKGAPVYEKAEDPIYVLQHDIPIDTKFYLRQLEQPLQRIFGPIIGEAKVASLFTGSHTRQIKISSSTKSSGIMRFAVKHKTCLGCKTVLRDPSRVVCEHCEDNMAELLVAQIDTVRLHERRFNELWAECQRCQQSTVEVVLCSNNACPVFYRRVKEAKSVQEAHERLARFQF